MPDSGITELPRQKVETPAFQQAKIRIEKSRRIRQDLKPENGVYNRSRVDEVRNIEMRSGQGDEAKRSGLEEVVVDTRGYQEKRFKMTYENPTGEEIDEELVMFAKLGEDGQIQWLSVKGQALQCSADLYKSRLDSHRRPQGADYRASVIPRIDGRGAYTGVFSFIESKEKSTSARVPEQQVQPAKPPEQATTGHDQTFYDEIGQRLRLNEQNPPKPDAILAPAAGNMFADMKEATLAGKVIADMYRQLVARADYQSPHSAPEMVAICKKVQQQYSDYVKAQLQERWTRGDRSLTFAFDHEAGTDGFHFQGDTTATRGHAYYFNKSHQHWKNPHAPEVRAYMTLNPQDMVQIYRHFVDLSLYLYDEGIDFSAKAASPAAVVANTDNMVLYISAEDQAKASGLIKKFMTERGLGQGHVAAAWPSPQEGLSWAYEPSAQEVEMWQKVSGSSQPASYNAVVATRAAPVYLDRLALAQARLLDTQSADTYMKEAQRVRGIILANQPKQP